MRLVTFMVSCCGLYHCGMQGHVMGQLAVHGTEVTRPMPQQSVAARVASPNGSNSTICPCVLLRQAQAVPLDTALVQPPAAGRPLLSVAVPFKLSHCTQYWPVTDGTCPCSGTKWNGWQRSIRTGLCLNTDVNLRSTALFTYRRT